ncbi:MAG: uncharacterized protein JWR28_472, partial [Modestobacter sp.]|nr:uncharacterized protein [Modestobacter sp.]
PGRLPGPPARVIRAPRRRAGCALAGIRDNGGVSDSAFSAAHGSFPDDVLAAAVEQARAAAVEVAADPAVVGDHQGVTPEVLADEAAPELGVVVTHSFAAALPGYVGWHWAVTLARVPGEDEVTLDEVVLLPGDAALLAPAWVPWHERLRPGDLTVGDVLPSTEDDPRLVPSYLVDDDSADDPAGRVVAEEIGIGRERVLSPEGRQEASERWRDGDFGPRSAMARHAPGPCATCGFFLPLAGSLRLSLGACANGFSPADGHVVTADYGCGAHSQATLERTEGEPAEVVLTARYDTADFDVI